jgi:hypothetical protein
VQMTPRQVEVGSVVVEVSGPRPSVRELVAERVTEITWRIGPTSQYSLMTDRVVGWA